MDSTLLTMLDRWRKRALMIGVIAFVVSLLLGFQNPKQFFHSYLFGFTFWIAISLGSMAITLLHHLSGGRWGAVVRRFLEAGMRTLPLMVIMFIPIVLGRNYLYEWSIPEAVAADPVLQHKSLYLNIQFFVVRAIIYFSIWMLLSFYLTKWSKQEDRDPDPALQSKFQFLGGIGLLLYGLTMTFASVDWMMSLDPHWFSTIYGLIVVEGQVLAALAFAIAVAGILVKYKPLSEVMAPLQFHDLGKLLFAFIMIWAYLSLSQFLIIWSGNLPEEIPWYLRRTHLGWNAIGAVLIVFHFTLPFLILLSRTIKRNPRILAMIAAGILFMRLVDLFYLVGPEFHTEGFSVHPLDILVPVALGGPWLELFIRRLKDMPLVPVNDPNLPEVAAHAGA